MKLNEITNQHAEIEAMLNMYKIENYTIHPDGTVDVDGEVDFGGSMFKQFPFTFGTVKGDFYCDKCTNLITLVGGPLHVTGDFVSTDCKKLDSLIGMPMTSGKDVSFAGCKKITSLDGISTVKIGDNVYLEWQSIKSHGIGLILTGCDSFWAPVGPFKIIEKYLGRPDDIFECQAELIEAGYAEYAQL